MAQDLIIVKLKNDSKKLLFYLAVTQILGIWLISKDLNYMTQNMNIETFQIPKVKHTGYEIFIAANALSITATFIFIHILTLYRLVKPYRSKAYEWFKNSFYLSIVAIFFEVGRTLLQDRNLFALTGVLVNAIPLLVTYKYFKSNKIKKWSVLPEPEAPDLSNLTE